MIVPGLLIRALASGHVRKNEALATSGPYAYTRNPLYLGSLLIGVGFAVAARSWWVGVALVFLRQKFPEFEVYARNVPRMFPRITPVANAQSGAFSFDLYLKHREYNALLGALALIAALVMKMMFLRQ